MNNSFRVKGEITLEPYTTVLNAVLRVRLEDVSLLDVPARVISQQVISDLPVDDEPIGFELIGADLNAKARYQVSAHLSLDGTDDVQQGDYVTMQSYPVQMQEKSTFVNVEIKRVR